MSSPARVMRDGQLEKRSSGLLQLWKKKRCVLTEDGLRLHACKGGGGGGGASDAPSAAWSSGVKELRFERMATVDCVEHKRGWVYFTVVMAGGEEIDFRCAQEGTAWNAEIALALVRYKNAQAVQTGRSSSSSRHLSAGHSGSAGEDDECDFTDHGVYRRKKVAASHI
ncbi:pleckstrin homology-like domain family A member 3 [Nelusetta ayraudi]|uniref:pleckstrin homology-like domain family A member 3 n=1 Tax=Nelusetta ayraudi TaxID=303726 RepID=UPI003F71C99D